MRVSGPSILARPVVRTETANTLASGASVFIEAESAHNLPGPAAYPADVKNHIEAGRAAVGGVLLGDSVLRQLNIPAMKVGGATGLFAGAAIGVLLDQLRAVHPSSAIAFDAACAVLGAAAGTAVGSGQFTLEGKLEHGGVGFALSPVLPK
jgi:hypothetical protein